MRACAALVLITISCTSTLLAAAERAPSTGPWDVEHILSAEPKVEWGDTANGAEGDATGLVRALRYQSEPYQGRDCWVFAYYGRPAGKGPFPAMLLVHGGGGKAFAEWAEMWTKRGYVALAMDLGGCGADGQPLDGGGPPQSAEAKFRPFDDHDLRDMWTYQAVAAVLRGHALLAAQGEVDRDRIGVTGISWGGYLTCIVAGIDHRLKVAVPVYGCGYLDEDSAWQANGTFDQMTPELRARWIVNFDPSRYLPGVSCPTLFVNGTNDTAYPLDSYQKSYQLVTAPRTLCITVGMRHSHPHGWAPAEIGAFVDNVLADGQPLVNLSVPQVRGESMSAEYDGPVPIAKAEFHTTTDGGAWKDRAWKTVAAPFDSGAKRIRATLPPERPLVGFFTVVDERGLTTSSEYVEVE